MLSINKSKILPVQQTMYTFLWTSNVHVLYSIHVHILNALHFHHMFIGVATPGPKGVMAQAIISSYNNNDIHSFNGCGKHVDSHRPTQSSTASYAYARVQN